MRRTLNNSLIIRTNMKTKSNSFIHCPIYFELDVFSHKKILLGLFCIVLLSFASCSKRDNMSISGKGCPTISSLSASGSLNVPLFPQQNSMWCWAACGQMCMTFLGATVDVSQCTQANNEFGKTNCCNNPIPSPCLNGGWPEFSKYGFSALMTNSTALSWAQIQTQIGCLNKPIAFTWHWTGGGGHMMVITGYAVIDSENWVIINDPWGDPNVGAQYPITYEDYVSGSDHTHWNDFYDITKSNSSSFL
jgi:Papain-like cysteine protease AvrRpt2